MTTQPTTPKRWRPRFSVRTLAIIITLVCCYAACWVPTKTRGVPDVQGRVLSANQFGKNNNVSATVPLIVGIEEDGDWSQPWTAPIRRCYYLWFFGYVAKLPYERYTPV
ncbi:MAG: hypothetical protein QGG71_13660 [Pirellulaceae bacterium]|jgi:hypothetical protein|nr:hypothetical protein [Pirellulaceae bacterium]